MKPLFSVVIPTRNRPLLMELNLKILKMQTFDNYEVIVSDNGTDALCRDVFDRVVGNDSRYRYVRPSKSLSLYDNFEYSISCAKGTYITLLEDKEFLAPDTMKLMNVIVEKENPIMISNKLFFYHFSIYPKGSTVKQQSEQVFSYRRREAEEVLNVMWNFQNGMDTLLNECPGLIMWGGFWHESLIARIKKYFGKVFALYNTDTGMQFSSCYLCDKEEVIIQVDVPLVIHGISDGNSRGMQTVTSQNFLKWSWDDCKNEVMKQYRLAFCDFLYSSNYFVAKEMEWVREVLNRNGVYKNGTGICVPNVLANVMWELESFNRKERSQEEKEHDEAVLENAIKKLTDEDKTKYQTCYKELSAKVRISNESRKTNIFINMLNNLSQRFPKLYNIYFFIKKKWKKAYGENMIYSSPIELASFLRYEYLDENKEK